MLTLTERAVAQTRIHQATHPETRTRKLRIWIADKNCDGFIYGVAFDDPLEGDRIVNVNGIEVLLDPGTAQYVDDAVVDWVDDERGRGFLVNNPRAHEFRGKFFLKNQ